MPEHSRDETGRTFVQRADVVLLRAVGAVTRGALSDLADDYQDKARNETEDLRIGLGGLWLTVVVLAGVLLLLLGRLGRIGDSPAYGVVAAALVGLPAALGLVHGVLEGIYQRDPAGRRHVRAADGNRTFLVTYAVTFLGAWLAFR